MIVIDTNILSELMRAEPSGMVVQWLFDQPASSLFTSAVTEAEILYGISILPIGQRRSLLEASAEKVFSNVFSGRVLPFDGDAAHAFAEIAARRRAIGRPISELDAQIAAITKSRGAVVATRNQSDFEECSIEIVNPWNIRH
ncbi:PIN domain-containing protein [Endothiovibrio diazotrophicus]